MATLRANISGKEQDIDNRETAKNYEGFPTVSQNFMNFGLLTAKIGS